MSYFVFKCEFFYLFKKVQIVIIKNYYLVKTVKVNKWCVAR